MFLLLPLSLCDDFYPDPTPTPFPYYNLTNEIANYGSLFDVGAVYPDDLSWIRRITYRGFFSEIRFGQTRYSFTMVEGQWNCFNVKISSSFNKVAATALISIILENDNQSE
jgi:hypothetical protein